ncbi:Uncharacterized protein HZ326_18083 [Fusarium oxysporum f. sp. albedinis]|nr:Uncharacterized protein HZ326_18083 [Fusarium oxysporum f. sp. albedinis]
MQLLRDSKCRNDRHYINLKSLGAIMTAVGTNGFRSRLSPNSLPPTGANPPQFGKHRLAAWLKSNEEKEGRMMDNPPFTTCCFLSLMLFDSVRLLRSKVPRLTRTLPQRAQTTRSGTDSAVQDQITQCCINRRGVFIHLLALAAALHPFGSFALPPFHLFLRCCSVIILGPRVCFIHTLRNLNYTAPHTTALRSRISTSCPAKSTSRQHLSSLSDRHRHRLPSRPSASATEATTTPAGGASRRIATTSSRAS